MSQALDKLLHRAALLLVATMLLGSPATADSRPSDQKMERFLLKAEVTRIHMVVEATTNPMAVDLERKGETQRAAFKYSQGERPDPGNSEYPGADQPSLDSYKHEVAAYRLDRALDMHMVPVAVFRDVKTPGALVEWISDAYTAEELQGRDEYPSDPSRLERQIAIMELFDALILNVNRKPEEILITPSDWHMHLIDHSRGFRSAVELPEHFLSRPARVPQPLLRQLEKLDRESMRVLLSDCLNAGQIDALLARRDLITEKIQADLEQYGEQVVFLE